MGEEGLAIDRIFTLTGSTDWWETGVSDEYGVSDDMNSECGGFSDDVSSVLVMH